MTLATDPFFAPTSRGKAALQRMKALKHELVVRFPNGRTMAIASFNNHERFFGESFRISLDVGFPTGIRLQTRLFESRFWAEVGTGVWWIVPYVSTALRYDCHLFEGSENLFAVRPSVSATLVPLGDGAIGFGADIEFIWQHRFTDRFVTDLGLRFGATAFHDEGGHWAAVPVLAIVFAVQF